MFKYSSRLIQTLTFLSLVYSFWYFMLREQKDGVEQLIKASDFQHDYDKRMIWENKERLVELVTENLPKFKNTVQDCQIYVNGEANEFRWSRAKQWKFNVSEHMNLQTDHQKCIKIVENFGFNDRSVWDEEVKFPLAFGITAVDNSNAAQLYYTLTALYHPHNLHCIAISSNATRNFMELAKKLTECLPNITIIQVPQLEKCKTSALNAIQQCFLKSTQNSHNWTYYQHLYSTDLPLKTNLEMVRILRRLNGTTIVDLIPTKTNQKANDLPIWRSTTSGLVSRQSAMYAVKQPFYNKTIEFLLSVKDECPEQLFWGTLFGNKNALPDMPGSFNAEQIFQKLAIDKTKLQQQNKIFNPKTEDPFFVSNWRLGQFEIGSDKPCTNCSFQLQDLKQLIGRHEFVAHKFDLNKEPTAYFCLIHMIRNRTVDQKGQQSFEGNEYNKSPQIRLSHGEIIDKIDFVFD